MLFLWMAAGLGTQGLSIVLETVLQRRPNVWGIRLAAAAAQLVALIVTMFFTFLVAYVGYVAIDAMRPDAPDWFRNGFWAAHLAIMLNLMIATVTQNNRFWHLLQGR